MELCLNKPFSQLQRRFSLRAHGNLLSRNAVGTVVLGRRVCEGDAAVTFREFHLGSDVYKRHRGRVGGGGGETRCQSRFWPPHASRNLAFSVTLPPHPLHLLFLSLSFQTFLSFFLAIHFLDAASPCFQMRTGTCPLQCHHFTLHTLHISGSCS